MCIRDRAIYVRIIYRAVKYLITCLRTFSIDPIQCLLYKDTQWLVEILTAKINVPIDHLQDGESYQFTLELNLQTKTPGSFMKSAYLI